MNQDFTYTETIDRYLKGQLSEEERRTLEDKMQQDPLLAQEVTWQKDIYHALGEVRRAALKSRLDQIAVHPNSGFFHQRWGIVAAVGALLLAGSTYYYLASEAPEPPVARAAQSPVTYPEAYTIRRTPPQNEVAALASEAATSLEASPSAKETSRPSVAAPQIRRGQPTAIPPQVVSAFDEDALAVDYNDFEAPEKSSLQENTYQEENVAIETQSDSRYTFHYQFFDNKLYLHGDFDRTPYKVIALNTENDKKLFLEFDGDYYRIGVHASVVPLVKIADPALVQTLKTMSSIN